MTILSDLIARARYARECGNFDQLHGELLDQVEFLEHEFEAERDRANEHFDARQDVECRLAALEQAVARVRELHTKLWCDGGWWCGECGHAWPCATGRALDGTEAP